MSEKQLWIVTRTVTGDSDYISTECTIEVSEDDARAKLRRFREICAKMDMFLPTGVMCVQGKTMKSNPDYSDADQIGIDDGVPKFIPSGGLYNGTMKRFDIDPDSLTDSEREFTVEMEVTRTYYVNVIIDEAKDVADANEQARDRLMDGELEEELCAYDEQDYDIQDTFET